MINYQDISCGVINIYKWKRFILGNYLKNIYIVYELQYIFL